MQRRLQTVKPNEFAFAWFHAEDFARIVEARG